MVLVSHDLDLVTTFADRAIYLERGSVAAQGPSDAVTARYRSDAAGEVAPEVDGAPRAVRVVEEGRRWGNGDIEIVAVEAWAGTTQQRLLASGEPCTVRIRYRVHRTVDDVVFGIAWHRADGAHVSGHNTALDGLDKWRLGSAGEVCCDYGTLALAPGEYVIDAAVHARGGLAYDYWRDALRVRVTSAVAWPGVWAPAHRWRLEPTGNDGE
jgi:ABC-2 type transport system ATP-binding protein/lipopolysaccharide transport system ATP-binding protein